jgi:hypothetical protein
MLTFKFYAHAEVREEILLTNFTNEWNMKHLSERTVVLGSNISISCIERALNTERVLGLLNLFPLRKKISIIYCILL